MTFIIIYAAIILLALINIIVIFYVKGMRGKKFLLEKRICNNMCVLIPARYESLVIEDLIISLENQTFKVNSKDIYVIVESLDDPTCEICKRHNVSIYLRQDYSIKTKGYALDETIKYILKNKSYDMYFIFDADNRLDPNFILEMKKVYEDGYDYSIGKRYSTNLKKNRFSYCSGLLFSLLNDLSNVNKHKQNKNIVASGTGYYISGDIIQNLGGFPFNSLTEDYEFSLHAVVNHYKSYYNTRAIFYDEQPVDRKTSFTQRVRWCKGFQMARKKYKKELRILSHDPSVCDQYFGVSYYISLIVIYVLGLITSLVGFIYNMQTLNFYLDHVIIFISLLAILLIGMEIVGLYVSFKTEEKRTFKSYVYTLFYFPIYLVQFIPIYFKARFTKVTWKRIKHSGK